jgi:L-threonylcarbamoyladenylate synthase
MVQPTELIQVNAAQPQPEAIQRSAAVLRAGGLVAFPTETVYGLGANALDAEAIQRIYAAKGRPANNPLIVHIAAFERLSGVALDIPPLAQRLTDKFWPGPLTLVLHRHSRIPENVSLGRDTIAVRMPAHPVALALIEAAAVPVAAPSANRFTRPSATSAQHVLADLEGRVDLILDAGPTLIGLESTVLDLTQTPPRLLRPGGVTLEALQAMIPDLVFVEAHLALDDDSARPASPGMLSKHYSPQAEVLLFAGEADAVIAGMRQEIAERQRVGQRVGVLALNEDAPHFADLGVEIVALGPQSDLAQVAHNLFAGLRSLDAAPVDVILVHQLEPAGLGATLNDRLLREAEGRVIRV